MKDNLAIILTVLSIIIPVFATLYTAQVRVRNVEKESHKPYLGLGDVEKIYNINRFGYFLAIIGSKFKTKEEDLGILTRKEGNINVELAIRNIGYGVASNIKFYNLETSKLVVGLQETAQNINQKKYTTFDIPKDMAKKVQACLVTEKEDGVLVAERHNILCIYQDLNENVYDFIICIEIKESGTYDFYAYQRSSHSYKRLINEMKSEYKKILSDYKK